MALCKGQHFILLLLCIRTQIRGFLRVARLGGGFLYFSPLAFETLGSRHSGSLLECLDSEQRCKGVTVGQGEHNTNVQKMTKKINFPFLDLYIRRSISVCILLCKEPGKGLNVVGWL